MKEECDHADWIPIDEWLSSIQTPSETDNNIVVANPISYQNVKGTFVFYYANVLNVEVPTMIQFISRDYANSNIWFLHTSPVSAHGNYWRNIKNKINISSDFSSEITALLKSYTSIK